MLDKAVAKVNELIALDMGSLVEKGDKTRERVSSTNESLLINYHFLKIISEKMARRKTARRFGVNTELQH